MADAGSPQAAVRAGFWRRALALLIDIVLIAFLGAVAGTILFQLTDGRLRSSAAVIETAVCNPVDPQHITLPSPPPFRITDARLCTKSFFGIVHDRTLRIENVTRSGTAPYVQTTYTRAITYPVDADGHVVAAHYIDYVTLIVFVLYVLLAEWRFGRTVGKRIMGIHVQSLGGGPITFTQAAKRALVRFVPWPLFALAFTLPLFSSYGAFFSFVESTDAQVLMLVFVVAALVFIGNFVQSTRRRTLTWYDRWAATEVVRD